MTLYFLCLPTNKLRSRRAIVSHASSRSISPSPLMSTPPSSSSSNGTRPIRVLKFGGTSVGDAAPLQKAATVIQEARTTCRPVVVVSAAAGVTNDLVRAADDRRSDRDTAEAWTRDVGRRYHTLADEVLGDASAYTQYETILQAELSELRRALQQNTDSGAPARDAVLATGERLMAPLVAAVLNQCGCPARPIDAASLVRTDDAHGEVTVQWEATQEQVEDWMQDTLASATFVPVVTGFVGGTADGTTTTLGRGGSDLSAAILARALGADRLERWTDVEGLYTRDPATNDQARPLDQLDFEQALTWTKAGRLGMHPRTLDPLASANIPVHVRCTHRPEADGTRIVPAVPAR